MLDLVWRGKFAPRLANAFIKVTPVTFINEVLRGGAGRERGRAVVNTASEN